jgi:acetyl esterase/lipase
VSERPTTERLRHEAMAKNGIVPIALDFRSGNEDPYPSSVQDINYAVRWAKLNARALKNGGARQGHLAAARHSPAPSSRCPRFSTSSKAAATRSFMWFRQLRTGRKPRLLHSNGSSAPARS